MNNKIPYRCPKCYTILARDPDFDNKLLIIRKDANHQCGVCGYFISSQMVAEGKYDVKTSFNKNYSVQNEHFSNLEDLLSFLIDEHKPYYYYRGQNFNWSGPLVPSNYRTFLSREPVKNINYSYRLRSIGRCFYETMFSQRKSDILPARVDFQIYLVMLFGYPLGNIFAQQCGLMSEGIDITHDPMIAALFSVFDFSKWSFIEEGTGVIYRFSEKDYEDSEKDITKSSLYNVPTYLSALDILSSMKPCDSWKESFESFYEYGFQLSTLNYEGVIERYPLEILAIPKQDFLKCRVIRQRAGLAFPDFILSKDYNLLEKKPKPNKANYEGSSLIEDISKREGVDCFFFPHSTKSKYIVPHSPNSIYPQKDILTELLKSLDSIIPRQLIITEVGTFGHMFHSGLVH